MIVLYCHCAFAEVHPTTTRGILLRRLAASGARVVALADLCGAVLAPPAELLALREEREVRVLACHPRAVTLLLAQIGIDPLALGWELIDLRKVTIQEALQGVEGGAEQALPALPAEGWFPWFPVIDRARCTGCGQCLSFCLFGVYSQNEAQDEAGRVQVTHPENCKTHCPACARVCPVGAIVFPKHPEPEIHGEIPAATLPLGEMNQEAIQCALAEHIKRRGQKNRRRLLAEEERKRCGEAGV